MMRIRINQALLAAAAAALAGGWVPAAVASDLIEAARDRDRATALALLDQGADAQAESPDGSTALLWAVYAGDVELVRALLDAGADVHAENLYGATPMSEAAVQADADMLALLLDAGADPEEPNADGMTPLMAVVRTANVDAAELLIARGADVNAIEQWKGQTALMWASAQRQPEMVRLLIEHGADPNMRSNLNNHERHITAEPRYLWRPPGGLTALIYAARHGCVGCAEALVEGGADIDMGDPEGASALLVACMNAHWDTAAYLIRAGAMIDKWDWRGRNPVYAAVDLNTLPHGGRPDQPSTDQTTGLEVLAMLLEAGANPNLQLKLNPGYRHTKDDRGSDGMLHNAGATPLLRAAKAFDTPAIELLLAHGALIDLPNDRGMLPILAAAGLSSRVADTRGYFDTPDVEQRSIVALQALIAGGADVNSADPSGQTALFAAAQWGWNEVVTFLVEQGADLAHTDVSGRTALDVANGRSQGDRGALGTPRPHTAALLERLMSEREAAPRPAEVGGG